MRLYEDILNYAHESAIVETKAGAEMIHTYLDYLEWDWNRIELRETMTVGQLIEDSDYDYIVDLLKAELIGDQQLDLDVELEIYTGYFNDDDETVTLWLVGDWI